MIIEMATIFKGIDGFDQDKLHAAVEKLLEENTEELVSQISVCFIIFSSYYDKRIEECPVLFCFIWLN